MKKFKTLIKAVAVVLVVGFFVKESSPNAIQAIGSLTFINFVILAYLWAKSE